MDVDHGEWTDKLSEYLDGELPDDERYAVESHLSGCAHCAAVLEDLKRVVARARQVEAHPPQADLWAGIAASIDARTASTIVAFEPRRRISFTLPQLAAAAAVLIAISAGLAWQTAERLAGGSSDRSAEATRSIPDAASPATNMERDPSTRSGSSRAPSRDEASAERSVPADDSQVAAVSFADPQYDAAVADLEKALKQGHGRLDESTIAIVEHNLQIIDQAIEQARQALASDPANNYLSSHLFEARRRKLDLLRRAAALTTESD